MRGITSAPRSETTRKARRTVGWRAAVALLPAFFAGCATPGVLHVYAVTPDAPEPPIRDHGGADAADTPSFLEADDELAGFAYDPFTDHFFLRLAPGNRIRVVDRPARAIKREFEIAGLGAGGDLAARPRDGHLFFLEERPLRIVETTRFGKVLRSLPVESVNAAIGVAVDPVRPQLFVLHAGGTRVSRHDLEGRLLASITLQEPAAGSLAFDAERDELHAPLAAPPHAVGVFEGQGRLVRRLPLAGRFVDLGPRSFIRVF